MNPSQISETHAIDVRTLVKRLRWIMLIVILFDIGITLLGQPASYWSDPASVHEENKLFRLVMAQGWQVSVGVDVIYMAGSFLLVSVLPWRIAMVLLFSLMFGHYFGGSSWLFFRYGLGAQGFIVYGIVLSVLIVLVGFRGERTGRGGQIVS